MFSRLNATQKGLILILVPVVFQLIFIAAINIPAERFAHDLKSMRMGKKILFALQENEIDVSKMIWLLMVSGPEESMRYLVAYHDKVQNERKWAGVDLQTDPEVMQIARDGRKIWQQMQYSWMNPSTDTPSGMVMGGTFQAAKNSFGLYREQRALMRRILALEHRKVAQQPEEIAGLRASMVIFLWGGFILSCLVSLALMVFFTKNIVGRLNNIAEQARLLAFGKLVKPEDKGTDEIADLEKTIAAASVKLAEARKRQAVILDNSADVICSLDSKLKFSAVGESVSLLWGFSAEQLLGKSVLTLLSPDTVESTSAALERIAQSTGDGQVENVVKCADGSLKNSIWTVFWSAEKRAFYCVVHDVTDLRTVEKLKQHFISVASHDLRAPLTSVTLNVSILTESMANELSSGVMQELDRVLTSAQRLTGLVNELLELDKLEAGKLSVELSRVLASDACEASKDLLFGMARQSQISILGPEGDAFVMAEEKRLVQMISNLLSNAIKFSPPGGKIELSIRQAAPYALISVKDEGCGMTAQECSSIFEKFSQADSAKSTAVKGTGLGLAVVKALVEAHGGRVEVVSELGKGTTFTLYIPLAAGNAEVQA
jgi:PAS domain S-box-containing protein